MQKQSFWMSVGFFALVGCSSTTFDVAKDPLPPEVGDGGTEEEDSATTVKNLDAGLDAQDGQQSDGGPLVCEPYSCKAGCGGCDAGYCGSGGVSSCGSRNCSFDYASDASAFNCPANRMMIYKCYHYPGQNTQDYMPRCVFHSGSTADGAYTQWCCPQSE